MDEETRSKQLAFGVNHGTLINKLSIVDRILLKNATRGSAAQQSENLFCTALVWLTAA
jgi:hypothetical protein